MTDPIAALPVATFLDQLAARTPAPGGGAAAAVAAALSAAAAQMVVSYSIGRKALAAHETFLREAQTSLAAARADALDLGTRDADAYAHLESLLRLPDDDPRRQREFAQARDAATDVPLRLLDLALRLADIALALATRSNPRLVSDLAVAAALADGAGRAAAWNVRANLAHEDRPGRRVSIETRLTGALERLATTTRRLETAAIESLRTQAAR
ncbi:MAG: cyclodeaminase/cyclohydrolase family protein [Phycisphaeraceae bacterium]|nr:cyclodeaminase/cyclohydrolase family protein [Phycisphaeraceae bacterium]